ncbi:polysaccharide lyase family 7 protein [Neiella marina]|uniref:Polysaccharide lyase family 7 protein n=2 Tax=Neiella holothuriorum TaxID=2870530 RepID=A0ABS7EHT4_9GAMM|nr:polysaccharide lyase family 7 protein [Neiella holothuriorum]
MSVKTVSLLAGMSLLCANAAIAAESVPADYFDLTHWYLQVPEDLNNDHRADTIHPNELGKYSHPEYFYLDELNRLVFSSPNKAATSKTSTNTRSEMRYLLNGSNEAANPSYDRNFSLAAHPEAAKFAAIGGRMEATLHVDHAPTRAGYPDKPTAYSVVIGQIHAAKMDQKTGGFGYGNEPLKIYYKKWPNHETGSVLWVYERNLETNNPNRIDIDYPVWGNHWDDATDPGDKGLALGEEFSYVVNVHEDTMYLTFTSPKHGDVNFSINLADNRDAHGNVDKFDHPQGYAGDPLYFKAGVYNQCSTKDDPSWRYPACPGTGDWLTDRSKGDYAEATFSRLVVTEPTKPGQ